MSQLKLLFLTPELPYPPVSGGKLKSWKLLEFLSKNYAVSVGSILKGDDPQHLNEFLSHIKIQEIYCNQVQQPRTALNLFKSYIKGVPLNIFRTYSNEFESTIANIIHDYDIVISDHYEVFQYIPSSYKGKVILHEHNAYYLMWERYAKNNNNSLPKRLVSLFESLRVKRYESNACNKADMIFASPNDIDSLSAIGVDRNKCKVTYHLGDDNQLKLPPIEFNKTSKSLIYVGSLGWEANIDGLVWFIENVWPKLTGQHSDLTFSIIGKNPDQRIVNASKNYPNIIFPGFVRDLEPYFNSHRIFVAPLRFGAGMKVKVLNAMCRGIPCVTTDIGIEGIDAVNNKHVLLANTPEEMFCSINTLLTHQQLWEDLKVHSRELIQKKYTWKSLFLSMQNDINELLKTDYTEQNTITRTILNFNNG